jgi:hypothetical protein
MKRIVVALEGGLGNQMFQYAAGRALSLRVGAQLALDVRPLLRQGQRAYGLGVFRLGEAELITEGKLPGRAGKIRRWLLKLTGGERTFREAGFPYDEAIRQVIAPARLEGYYQSERYFEDVAEVIRADFTPPADELGRLDDLASRLLPSGPKVALHVRRGDYTSPATMAVHGLMGPDYYARARHLLAERTGPSAVCVFTDDPAWVRANLGLPADSVFVSEHTRSAVEDLILMSRCSHHITANSSFSWWGAWLNPKPDKVVVTPSRWFQPTSGLDTRDLRPAGWLQA